MKLENATALITGGSSGIGQAIAQTLVEAGTHVAITGRDEKKNSQKDVSGKMSVEHCPSNFAAVGVKVCDDRICYSCVGFGSDRPYDGSWWNPRKFHRAI